MLTKTIVIETLLKLKSAPSGIRMSTDNDYRFEVQELEHEDSSIHGFLIRCGFWRPDTNTGEMGEGFGRWMHIPCGSTPSGVVKTAFLCIDLVVRHEMMEAMEYEGVKVFDPHKSLEELAYPKKLGGEVIGCPCGKEVPLDEADEHIAMCSGDPDKEAKKDRE